MPAHKIAVLALAVLSSAVPSSAQSPAFAQLQRAAGASPAVSAAAPASGVPLPPHGNQEQLRAWDELVRPLAYWAAQMDPIERAFAAEEYAFKRMPSPGSSLWGKDIVGRLDLKGHIATLTANRRAELRARQAAHAIAWRLYARGEISRLDEQGRALAEKHLERLLSPERDLSLVIEKLRSFRQGEPGMISRSLDASIATGLDDLALSAAHIRAYIDATRVIMAPPAPAPARLGTPVPSSDGWRPARR